METDPGTQILDEKTVDRTENEFSENDKFWHRPRWHAFGGKQPPMSPARTEAIRRKRAWDDVRNAVPVGECLSGDELVAERAHVGDGTSFRFATVAAGGDDDDGPATKLRWLDAMILAAVAYAMLCRKNADGSPCRGLVATLGELAQFTGAGVTAIRRATHKLVALGLLTCDVTFVAFHAVTNQRGNLYRVTTQAVHAYGLQVPRGLHVPTGTVALGSRGLPKRVGNPEGESLSENRAKSTSSSGMPSRRRRGGVGSADADLFRTVVTDAAPVPSQPDTRQGETCDAFGSSEGESRDEIRAIAAEDLRDLIGDACFSRFAKAGAL